MRHLWLNVRMRIGLIFYIIAAIAAIVAAARTWGQQIPEDSRVAVLELRANQIDKHLDNTDVIEQRIWTALGDLSKQLAAQSERITADERDELWERRIGWIIIVALCSGSAFSVRKRLAKAVQAATEGGG